MKTEVVKSRRRKTVCGHLVPVVEALDRLGYPLASGRPCPHDPEWGTWYTYDYITSNRPPPEIKLDLDHCVSVEPYQSLLTGTGDITYYCDQCQMAIELRYAFQ